jgi:hypothetical protein
MIQSGCNKGISGGSLLVQMSKRWATKKMGSSKARQKRAPEGKRLGLKKYSGILIPLFHLSLNNIHLYVLIPSK